MSTIAATPTPIYTTDIGAPYSVDLSQFLGNNIIVSVVVVLEWSASQAIWSIPNVSLQSNPAAIDTTGTIITAYVGNGATPVGWVRIRSTVTTNAVPTWIFDDVASPSIQVLSDIPPA